MTPWNEIERELRTEVYGKEIPLGPEQLDWVLAFFKDRTTPKKSGRKTKKKT